MWVKMGVIIMLIVMSCQLLGEIKSLAGELLVPTATGEIRYKGTITITSAVIEIECHEKIFQPFNEPNAPKQEAIRINTSEVERISLQRNGVVIFPKTPLCNRYRNLLHRMIVGLILSSKRMAFIFVIDMDVLKKIGSNDKEIIDRINKRNDPEGRAYGFVRYDRGY
ncbi:MAG: hypothetical protein PVH61_27885 [Candidatus Aminicenantes bacterium]|jgi:hypothetical protein